MVITGEVDFLAADNAGECDQFTTTDAASKHNIVGRNQRIVVRRKQDTVDMQRTQYNDQCACTERQTAMDGHIAGEQHGALSWNRQGLCKLNWDVTASVGGEQQRETRISILICTVEPVVKCSTGFRRFQGAGIELFDRNVKIRRIFSE